MSDYSDFDHFGLDPRLVAAVRALGYTRPTPIQSKAIPIVMRGGDVMGAAQTGTGKTAGFSLPILHRLLPHASTSMSPARHPVRALMLAPTRELADQVAVNVRQYASQTPLRTAVVYGGIDMNPQTQALRGGVDVLVATPGRLLDHLQSRNTSLSQVQVVVLDEADRMLDMGFLPDISRILNQLPKERQSLMFSATFSGEIKKLAGNFLRDPVLVEVARSNATAENVRQSLVRVHESEKDAALTALLRDNDYAQVLVFVNTKIGARRLARQLERDGVAADSIHGDKTQDERTKALEAFKAGSLRVLVATDVAARGLDITELPAVVNYDVPFSAEDYVHRIGRTGRAGAAGVAFTIASGADDKAVAAIETLIKRSIDPVAVELRGVRTPGPARPDPGPQGSGRHGSGRDGSGSSDSGRPARVAPVQRKSAPPVDDFFLKPYEPAPSASAGTGTGTRVGSAATAATDADRKPPVRRAALLGGGRR